MRQVKTTLGHQINILKAYKSVLSEHAQMVKIFACLVQEKNKNKVSLASLKTLANSKINSESRIKFLFRLSFVLIGRLSPAYMHARLSGQFPGSQAAFGTIFRVTGGYRKAGTSSLKRATGRIFKISSKQKLYFGFCS
jgi:hypothetical protein